MTSSLSFLGNQTSYLRIQNTDAFDFVTGDFTIEWYQYQTDSNSHPRIFQVGTYPSTTIGVSIEGGGTFFFWQNSSSINCGSLGTYQNVWIHFAISRSGGVLKIFKNGVSIYSANNTTNFNGTADLIIGNESNVTNYANLNSSEKSIVLASVFGGYITYFSWVKGTGLYTSNFTVPTTYPTLTNDYILLLKSNEFLGTLGNTVVNSNVGTVTNIPPGFSSSSPPSPPSPSPFMPIIKYTKPLFSNNSMVFYNRGSLPSCGVGSVRNSSVKSRKI